MVEAYPNDGRTGNPLRRWSGRRRIELRRHRGERGPAEDRLDREPEVLGDAEREVEARVELAALQVADRLVVHADRRGEVLARQPPLGAQHGEPVVEDRVDAAGRSRHQASSSASGSIHVSAAAGSTGNRTATHSTSTFTDAASITIVRPNRNTARPATTTAAITTSDRIS